MFIYRNKPAGFPVAPPTFVTVSTLRVVVTVLPSKMKARQCMHDVLITENAHPKTNEQNSAKAFINFLLLC